MENKMNLKFVLLLSTFLCFFTGNGQCKDILDYKNLEGLQTINERITIEINVSGDEPFNLDESKIRDVIKKRLRDINIKFDNESNTHLFLKIDGETTGGGGSKQTIKLSLLSLISSPFKNENKISVILWFTEIHKSDVMTYDPEKQRIINVNGPINERMYITIEEMLNKFQQDYKNSNKK
jgi:hypothetical protein